MALSSDEFRARCLAAAALHGTGMRGLRDILDRFGADKTLAESLIKDEAARRPKQIRDLAEALEVPRAWFTEPDWRDLIPGSGAAAREPQAAPARELETDLEDASRRSESTGSHSGEQEPEVPKTAEE